MYRHWLTCHTSWDIAYSDAEKRGGAQIQMDPEERITREMLYEAVWTDPVSKVAVRYGISGVALAKVCRKHKVPIPSRGYWAKLNAGKTPKRTPLPRAKEFDSYSLPLSRAPLNGHDTTPPSSSTPTTALLRIGAVKVPDNLTAPHPLIRAASKRLKRKTGWNNHKGLRSAPGEVFHLEVTRSAIDRALLIADTLTKELEKRNIKVRIDHEKKRTVIDVETVSLELIISEHVARTKHEATTAERRAIQRWERPQRVIVKSGV
jgi:hypothetical protein